MGLDMYLEGRKYDWNFDDKRRMEDGFEVSYVELKLGYWRKHANLHGYIVETFAKGVDECQQIELSVDDLKKTIVDIQARKLPQTTGFFFGRSANDSDGEAEILKEIAEDVEIINKAIAWVETKIDGEMRTINYRASW